MNDLIHSRVWRTWRQPVTADDAALGFTMGVAAAVKSRVIVPHPASAIAVQVLGKDADNETATIEIVGRMDDQTKSGCGPPFKMWKGQVILGSVSSAASIPLSDGRWGAAATWFNADTYDVAGVAGGHNTAQAVTLGSIPGVAILLLPTLGYTHLEMHISDVNDGGVEMAECGAIFREISRGGVL